MTLPEPKQTELGSNSDTLAFLKGRVVLVEKGIVENIVNQGEHLETEDIKEFIQLSNALSKGNKHCILVTSGHLTTISKEAMRASAKLNESDGKLAMALMVEFVGQRLIGNFYLAIMKPKMKTKLFTNREKALEWLRSIRDSNI